MNKASLLPLIISAFIVSGCEKANQVVPDPEIGRSVDPLRCVEGGVDCDMNWNITTSRHKFPDNIQLLINDKVIFDECERTGNVAVTRGDETVNVKIWKYVRLDGNQDFKFQVNDLQNCYDAKKVFYVKAIQDYTVVNVNGEKHVQIDL